MTRRVLPLLAAANFAAASAGMIISGILQLIAADLQWSPSQAGQLITTYAVGFAVGAPLLGAAIGNWCRKRVVILGLCLVAFGSLLTALATQSPWIEVSRLVVAAGAAMTIPSVSAIAAYLHPEERPRALSFVLMGMTLAMVLGVPLGTLLAGRWGWHAPLFGAAALTAAAALSVKLLLPGGIVVPPVPLSAWRALLTNPRSYPLLGLSMLVVAASFCLFAYLAPFLNASLGAGTHELSLLLFWYGLASLAASAVLGWFSQRLGAQRLLPLSLLVLTVTLAATLFTQHSMPLMALVFGVWAACGAFFGILQQARVVEAAPQLSTALLALNTSANFAGQAMGTVIGGWVIALAGLQGLPWAAAALAGLGLLLLAASRHGKLA